MDILPFDFFRAESSHNDVVIRTDAMSKVTIVCALMSADKVRSEMLPYLLTRTTDMDQVLLQMAKKIGDFLPYIGGPEYAHHLVALIESLCNIEEITIRSAAAASACKIIAQLSSTHIQSIEAFFQLFQRLSNEETGDLFYGRVCACFMIAELYKALPTSERATLREIYSKLMVDELSMVRRIAGQIFIDFANIVEAEVLKQDFLPLIKSSVKDEHASVKVIAIENLSAFAALMKKYNADSGAISELIPIVKQSVEDSSWRIRLALSKKYSSFATCFQITEITHDIFPGAMTLVLDVEPDVRTLALQGVTAFVPVVGASIFISEFGPVISQLVEDPIPQVRKILADVCIDVATMVGEEATSVHIVDVVMKLINDEDPLVRLRILKKLDVIAQNAPTLCNRLTSAIKAMFDDPNWRVRKRLSTAMPAVLKYMGKEYFVDHFMTDFLQLLMDGVDEVRNACAASVPEMVAAADVEWVFEKIFPSVQAMATSEYLIRQCMLTALNGLFAIDMPDKYVADMLALLIGATNDKVPNIRLRAAQVLGVACKSTISEASKAKLRQILVELKNDSDKDVKHFATVASS